MMVENSDKIALWLRRQPDAPGGSIPIRRHRWPYYGSEKDLATHYRSLFQDVYTPYLSQAADTRQNFDWFEVRVQCSSPAHNTPITTDLCLTHDLACDSEAAFGSTVLHFRGHNRQHLGQSSSRRTGSDRRPPTIFGQAKIGRT